MISIEFMSLKEAPKGGGPPSRIPPAIFPLIPHPASNFFLIPPYCQKLFFLQLFREKYSVISPFHQNISAESPNNARTSFLSLNVPQCPSMSLNRVATQIPTQKSLTYPWLVPDQYPISLTKMLQNICTINAYRLEIHHSRGNYGISDTDNTE